MSTAVAHIPALQLIQNIAEGSTTANSLPHIARIAASALGGVALAQACAACGRVCTQAENVAAGRSQHSRLISELHEVQQ